MKVIFGSGGVAREVEWLIHDLGAQSGEADPVVAYVAADADWKAEQSIAGIPIWKESAFLESPLYQPIELYVAVGLPIARERIVHKARSKLHCTFPSLIHPRASLDSRPNAVRIGAGVIIYPSASLTTDVDIEDFVQINPGATVAHQSRIGAFSTICPGAMVCGYVAVGRSCFIGAGAVIRDKVRIVDGCTIGAGAVVACDIDQPGTWAGVPARYIGPVKT